MGGAFLALEAPVRRVTAYDGPLVGFGPRRVHIPDAARVVSAARDTLAY